MRMLLQFLTRKEDEGGQRPLRVDSMTLTRGLKTLMTIKKKEEEEEP